MIPPDTQTDAPNVNFAAVDIFICLQMDLILQIDTLYFINKSH